MRPATIGHVRTTTDSLVAEHLGLARHLALRYTGRGVETDDLVQVANLALVKAARGYDAAQGAFAPYAAATIRGDIKKYFRDQAWMVRPPRRVQELQASITSVRDEAPASLDDDDLAEALDVDAEEVTEALAARGCFSAESTDRPIGSSGRTLGEMVPVSDPRFDQVDEWVTFCRLCGELSSDERELLYMRFVQDRTQQQIADRLDISQMQVSRRLRRLFDSLRARADAAAA